MDAEEIIEEADSAEILNRLDITLGNKQKCLCPYHVGYGKQPTPEHDFGSCGIVEKGTWKGIHCFVCGKSWSLQQLVMDKLGCGYIEALSFICGKSVKIQFSSENSVKGHGKAFAGTVEMEGNSEIVEYRTIGNGYKSIKGFLENKPICKGTVPEIVNFDDEGIAINRLPADVKKYFYNILISELETDIAVEAKNRKDFMLRREKIKQLNKLKKEMQ